MNWTDPSEIYNDTVTGPDVAVGDPNSSTVAKGPSANYEEVKSAHFFAVQATAASGPGTGVVGFEGSLDGVNWYSLEVAQALTTLNQVYHLESSVPAKFVRASVTATSFGGGQFSITSNAVATGAQ